MFAQQAKDKAAASAGTGYQQKDLSEVTCNNCNEKGHYQRSPACPIQKKLTEDTDKYRASQSKSESTTTEAKQAFMNGIDSDDFSNPQAMFCQTSQVVSQMEQNANASPHRSAF